jgi:hypothetical protein
MDRSGVKNSPSQLPSGWLWEQLQVVDAGHGEVALWSQTHKRFMKMTARSQNLERSKPTRWARLPKMGWSTARFVVVDAGQGDIALFNRRLRRFVRMNGHYMDRSSVSKNALLPRSWAWERFRVQVVSMPKSKPIFNAVGKVSFSGVKRSQGVIWRAPSSEKGLSFMCGAEKPATYVLGRGTGYVSISKSKPFDHTKNKPGATTPNDKLSLDIKSVHVAVHHLATSKAKVSLQGLRVGKRL